MRPLPDLQTRAFQEDSLAAFVGAGYGGIGLGIPTVFVDLNDGVWVTVTTWDETLITNPRLIGQEVVGDGLIIEAPGIYQLNLFLSVLHNQVNDGRTMGVRLFNFDLSNPGPDTFFGTGRNSDITTISVSTIVEIAEIAVGDLFQVQLSGGPASAYTGVTIVSAQYSLVHVSPFAFALDTASDITEPLTAENGDRLTTEDGVSVLFSGG